MTHTTVIRDMDTALRIPEALARRLRADVRYLHHREIRGHLVETVVHGSDGSKLYSVFPVWLLPRNRPARRCKPVKEWR